MNTPDEITIQKDRLLLLADKLETIPDKKFFLRYWRCAENPFANNSISISDQKLLDPECDTTGCAIGHACAMPEFQELGLYWDNYNHVPSYQEHKEEYAAMAFFGLYRLEFMKFFLCDFYKNGENTKPREVASHIRLYLNALDNGSERAI